MPTEVYELVALAARIFFTALMLLIVLRAAYGAIEDSRRAARLRRLAPMTGISGELVVLESVGRVHAGMRYPVIREGMIGASNRADVRIRHTSVRRRHGYFRLDEDGLHVRSHAGARLKDAHGKTVRELTLTDGDGVIVGDVKLMLVLHFADAFDLRERPKRENPIPSQLELDAFDEEEDDLFHTNDAFDAYDETDEFP